MNASSLELFDAHCHIQDPRYTGHAVTIVEGSRAAGISGLAVCGTSEDDWPAVGALARQHSAIISNIGLHPWKIAKRSERWLPALEEQLLAAPSAGLGEVRLRIVGIAPARELRACGLDKGNHDAGMAEQEDAFRAQLELGKRLRRPISVHCVRAFGPLTAAVRDAAPFPAGLVLHSWAGSAEFTAQLARLQGVHFSVSGQATRLSPAKAAAMLAQVPLERLLLETDAPDGLPRITDADLAARVEDAAGCQLEVMLQPEADPTAASPAQGAATSGLHAGQRGAADTFPNASPPQDAESTGGAPASSGSAARAGVGGPVEGGDIGESSPQTQTYVLPLCWTCPVAVRGDGGREVHVRDPGRLLNLPANLRVILHFVAEMRRASQGEAADVLAAATLANARRLFNRN